METEKQVDSEDIQPEKDISDGQAPICKLECAEGKPCPSPVPGFA